MIKRELVFLNNLDLLPEEIKDIYINKKYGLLPEKVQDLLLKEELIKWCIAMNYCKLDFNNYLSRDIGNILSGELREIKIKAKL